MGSQGSKAAKGDVMAPKPAEAAAPVSPSKSNGQENGHVKINGDVSPKADGEAPPLNGNGSAEPIKEETRAESSSGDAIEPAPAAEGREAKPEGAAACKETPNKKKKKKFSFKKSLKLSGISFRKNKEAAGDSARSSPTEEQGKAEAKGEENPTCSTNDTEQTSTPQEGKAEEKGAAVESSVAVLPAEGQQEAEPKKEDAEAGEAKEEEEQQLGESQEVATAKPEEPSKSVVPEPSTTPAATEPKEE